MKTYRVQAFFPEVIAHKAHQSAQAKGDRIGLAVDRALSEIVQRDGIRYQRISVIKLTVAIVAPPEET